MSIVLTGRDDRVCVECGRHLYKRGVVLSVEAAIDPNGDSPVVAPLESLRNSRKKVHNQRYYDLMERFAQLSAYGKLEVPRQMNQIGRDGLWEVKTSEDRVPFYFAEAKITHHRAARLTHFFEKRLGKTAQGQIPRAQQDKAEWIAKGDNAIG